MSSHNTDIVWSVVRECELSSCTSIMYHFNGLRRDYTDIVEVKGTNLCPLQCHYHSVAFKDFRDKMDANIYNMTVIMLVTPSKL